MVADAIDKSRATAGKRIDWAIDKELFNEVRWHDQRTVRVLSFDREQKRKYLSARQLGTSTRHGSRSNKGKIRPTRKRAGRKRIPPIIGTSSR